MRKTHPVLVVGDIHAPAMLEGYPDFLQRVYDRWNCRDVVFIGDLVDFHCFSYHERNPDVAVSSEIDAAIDQIAVLTEMFPRASLLIGNHDDLVQRQAMTAGLSSRVLVSFKELLNLPKTWNVYPRYHKLICNRVLYQHGDQGKGGQQAALKNAHSEFMSVVQGHHHSQCGIWYHSNESKLIFGMQTGCGIDRTHMQMAYGTKFSAKPIIGCGVVVDSVTAYVETMHLGEDP
jgi:hypothetical protein